MLSKKKIKISGIVNSNDGMFYLASGIGVCVISICYGHHFDNYKDDLEHSLDTLKIIAFDKLMVFAENRIAPGSKILVKGKIYRHEFDFKDSAFSISSEPLIKAEQIKIIGQYSESEFVPFVDELETMMRTSWDDRIYKTYNESINCPLEEISKEGTEFQERVWEEIGKIPRGEVRTYKEIAIAIGRPNSARAVANACGKNPRPIEIPCHRVIRSDGHLGGYSGKGGPSTKRKLLKKEGISLNSIIM